MKLKIIDIDNLSENLEEITNPKIIDKRKFSPDGLFSQQIFGPIKSYHCACNVAQYKGPSSKESKCNACGVEIISSESRKKRFAKITLPFSVLNPIFYYLITNSKPSCKKIIDNMINYRYSYLFDDNGEIVKIEDGVKVPENSKLEGLDGCIKYIEMLVKSNTKAEFQYVKNNFHLITLNNIIVIPPDFRHCGKNSKGKYVADNINQFYSQIIITSNHIKNIPYQISKDDEIYKSNFKYIQNNIFNLYDYILNRMSKKDGLIRSNILGKRMDFSGRSVISPDPTLNLEECSVPYVLILEIFKPQLSSYLVNRKFCKRYNQAVAIIEECIQNEDRRIFNLISEFCEDKVCIINRQPTLHRTSVLGFKIKVHFGKTIKIHPLITDTINGDFDGDAVSIYIPTTEQSISDVKEKILITKNMISGTNATSIPKMNQDIILGIYSLTK